MKAETEAIVNASNGCGIMGKGVAGAIRAAAGKDIEKEAKDICRKNGTPISAGDCYKTSSGRLAKHGIKVIYHAVTMKYPGSISSLYIVGAAMRSVLSRAYKDGVKSIAIPGLGIGIGALNKEFVAKEMVRIAQKYETEMDIVLIDFNEEFIKYVTRCITGEQE